MLSCKVLVSKFSNYLFKVLKNFSNPDFQSLFKWKINIVMPFRIILAENYLADSQNLPLHDFIKNSKSEQTIDKSYD